jgi:hypothetical protein
LSLDVKLPQWYTPPWGSKQNSTGQNLAYAPDNAADQKRKDCENKVTTYPLTTTEIVSWYRSKQSSLKGSAVSLVDIKEHVGGPKPAAAADFDGPNSMGQICGWVSGEFDFEALRASDGKDILWRHLDVSAVDELEEAYADFLRTLMNPELTGAGAGAPGS